MSLINKSNPFLIPCPQFMRQGPGGIVFHPGMTVVLGDRCRELKDSCMIILDYRHNEI